MIIRSHFGRDYDNKRRMASYWHQVDECCRLGGESVLVVGVGSSLASILLQRQRFSVTSLDIQHQLYPTVVGDVLRLPFKYQSFDVAVCCQVLEHLPRESFVPALRELRSVIRRGAVLSLPDCAAYSTLMSRVLRRKEIITLPHMARAKPKLDAEHIWEISMRGHPLSKVQRAIEQGGFSIEKTFRVWEIPFHRFFRLRALMC
jgi:2-polyprenyl-3-methyl-5-hydroxy-6-metoxy-1,4-benzoquinol methylase